MYDRDRMCQKLLCVAVFDMGWMTFKLEVQQIDKLFSIKCYKANDMMPKFLYISH